MSDELLNSINHYTWIPDEGAICGYCDRKASHTLITFPCSTMETLCRRHIEAHTSWVTRNGFTSKPYCLIYLRKFVAKLKREHLISLSLDTKPTWKPTWKPYYTVNYTSSADYDGTWHVTTYST